MEFAQSHPFLTSYLRYTENTESPKLFHVWAAISAVSACLGRRCWYNTGVAKLWPNMYVVLSGPPGTRKSSSIKYARALLEEHTGIRFAPSDTGGARQGLISAMTDLGEGGDEELAELLSSPAGSDTFASVGNDKTERLLAKLSSVEIDMRDPRTMYVASNELNSFLGENNTSMLTFLIDMWDGTNYSYRLRNANYELKDALLGILGATTPSQLALALPPEAIGQGFTSRIIFAHADKQYRRIPRPSLDETERAALGQLFGTVFHRFDGEFTETASAAANFDRVYMRGAAMPDPRFLHYCDRRHDHLRKVAMSLAAGRGSQTIEQLDVELADQILLWTEESMSDALGEYGMNKLGAAKQRMIEYINNANEPIPLTLLYGFMSRDMTRIDFNNIVADLHNTKRATRVVLPQLGDCIIAVPQTEAKKARSDNKLLEGLLRAVK